MNNIYVYTETAFHHQGDLDFLKELIKASKKAGAKGVKFQVLTNVNDFVSTYHKSYNELSKYCFDMEQWREIFRYTLLQDLDIIMMPLNVNALELIKEFDIRYLDIHSVSFNDKELLENVKASQREIILGVGGRTLDEIRIQEIFFGDKLKVLMVGFQSFPSKLEKVRIGKIRQLKRIFPNLIIGYADHSSFDDKFAILSNEYARLLGATFFEKHITIVEGTERVDSSSAISPEKIREINDRLDFIEEFVLNEDQSFLMENEEIIYRNRQLICVANKNLEIGETIHFSDIKLKLVDNPENCYTIPEQIIGKTIESFIRFDEPIKSFNLS